jgi:acyl carrier protein
MSDTRELVEKIKVIIADILNVEPSTIQSDATFESLGIDSLDMLEIIMKLEEQFGIEIDDEKAASITSIEDAARKIEEIKANK